MKTAEDHVLAGAEGVFEDAEDLDVHGLGSGAFKDGVGDAHLAAMELGLWIDAGRAGGRKGGRLGKGGACC